MRYFSVARTVPTKNIVPLLPFARLNAYRAAPDPGLISITALQEYDCDIGPYNEVSIGFPVAIDREVDLFSNNPAVIPETPMGYVWHIPVNTPHALDAGIEIAGHPKILADIVFDDTDQMLSCRGSRVTHTNFVRRQDRYIHVAKGSNQTFDQQTRSLDTR